MKGSSPHCESGPGGCGGVGGQENYGTDQAGTEPWPCLEEGLPLEGALFVADLGQLVQSVWSGQALDGPELEAAAEEGSVSGVQAESKDRV